MNENVDQGFVDRRASQVERDRQNQAFEIGHNIAAMLLPLLPNGFKITIEEADPGVQEISLKRKEG